MGHTNYINNIPQSMALLLSILLVRTAQVVEYKCPYCPLTIGGNIHANFLNTDSSAISSCTLDGQPMSIEQDVDVSVMFCTSNNTVPHGSHIFMVTVNTGLAQLCSFDYISYEPGDPNIPLTDVDVMYNSEDSSIKIETNSSGLPGALNDPGDSLDFTFVGE